MSAQTANHTAAARCSAVACLPVALLAARPPQSSGACSRYRRGQLRPIRLRTDIHRVAYQQLGNSAPKQQTKQTKAVNKTTRNGRAIEKHKSRTRTCTW